MSLCYNTSPNTIRVIIKRKTEKMSLNDFQIMGRLGEGAYSSVYRVRRLTDGNVYALKKVRMFNLSEKEKENALNEVRILASISNPYIISYKQAFVDDASQSLCLVMEFADNGDLFQKICEHQKNSTCFTESEVWSVFIQIVTGLKALHGLQILHRDLKSANVFLFKDSTAKLGDLNVSKVAKKGLGYTQTGTPYYASPEVWRDQPYDVKSDIWSLGCVLYEMITLKPPFRAEDMASLYKKVLKGVYPKIPSVYSHELSQLVRSLLQVSPHLRPTCERLLRMPSVLRWAEKLFPSENPTTWEQNILLNTIRIPKNLLYLTDRLPKPRYASVDEAGESSRGKMNRLNVTDGAEYEEEERLPAIPSHKLPKHKAVSRVDKEQYIPKHHPIMRQYKIPRAKKAEQVSVVEKPSASGVELKRVETYEAQPVMETEKEAAVVPTDSPKQEGKKRQKLRQVAENDGRNAVSILAGNKKNFIENLLKNNGSHCQDPYLNQIIARKNHIIRPINDNIKDLANIYTGAGNAKGIIAMHKRKIDRLLELNKQEKERSRLLRVMPKMHSMNPPQVSPEMNLRMELPPPFKVKGLMPRPVKKPLQRLPHYNQELILEARRQPSYSPIRVGGGIGKQPELYE